MSKEQTEGSAAIPPTDFFRFLIGKWKRNLEWREFGGIYEHLSTSNTFVQYEENSKYESSYSSDVSSGNSGNRYARFSFGNSLHDLKFAYEIIFSGSNNAISAQSSTSPVFSKGSLSPQQPEYQNFQWKYLGVVCKGEYYPSTGVATFKVVLPTAFVTTTYKVVDQNTMSVVIVEVDEKQQPTIQYGNMYRLTQ